MAESMTKHTTLLEIFPDYELDIKYTYDAGDDPIYEGSNGGYPGSKGEVTILHVFIDAKDENGNSVRVDVKQFLEKLDEDQIYNLETQILEEHEDK